MAFISFLFGSMSLAIWAALDNPAGTGSLIIFAGLAIVIFNSMSLRISVDNELRVGRAHIETKFIGEVREVSGAEFKQLQTKDARAFLATRFWLNQGVVVEIKDERDPTPYWLISCKNAAALKRSLYKPQ